MVKRTRRIRASLTVCILLVAAVGCGPRVVISTGTTLGLKATPGDGQSRPPQVTLAYKRQELALIPTQADRAERGENNIDAYSTLAMFHFSTTWFGKTEIHSFLGTGFAAREIQEPVQEKDAKSAGAPLRNDLTDLDPLKVEPQAQGGFWRSFSEGRGVQAGAHTPSEIKPKRSQ